MAKNAEKMKAPSGEMTEKNLVETLNIFSPTSNWEVQKRFSYDPENKRKFYRVDAISESERIIWEYDGPNHYNDTWKLQRDIDRDNYFKDMGYTIKRWPYFYQLTKDVAKDIFVKEFSEEKYLIAIKLVYGVDSENHILSPGWHTTKFTPGSWIERGVERFLDRLEIMPKSLKHQLVFSLLLYIKHVGDSFLIIGDHSKLHELIKLEIDEDYINYYFTQIHAE